MPVLQVKIPYWVSPNKEATLYHGHVIDVLSKLPARKFHTCITSPPYYALRDYGTATWEGGDELCPHNAGPMPSARTGLRDLNKPSSGNDTLRDSFVPYKKTCGKCGAKRIDKQIGAEPSPDCGTHGQAQCGGCFVCSMVAVFREVRRVLRDDGTLWLNLGDSYSGSSSGRGDTGRNINGKPVTIKHEGNIRTPSKIDLPSGNLVGVPWRVALALQADGWVLRSHLPWVKRNAMPESALNRPSKAVEDIFMLTKGEGYFFDMEAVKPTSSGKGGGSVFGKQIGAGMDNGTHTREYDRPDYKSRSWRNSDLWFASATPPHGLIGVSDELVGLDVTMKGYSGAHFAVYPPDLIRPLILCSTSEHGCCAVCGTQYERIVSRENAVKTEGDSGKKRDRSFSDSRSGVDSTLDSGIATTVTVGWRKVCACDCVDVEPCLVLDPFMGSGTTAATAIMHGRCGIGIDLNEKYLRENAVPRIEAAIAGEKVGRKGAARVLPNGTPLSAKPISFGKKL